MHKDQLKTVFELRANLSGKKLVNVAILKFPEQLYRLTYRSSFRGRALCFLTLRTARRLVGQDVFTT